MTHKSNDHCWNHKHQLIDKQHAHSIAWWKGWTWYNSLVEDSLFRPPNKWKKCKKFGHMVRGCTIIICSLGDVNSSIPPLMTLSDKVAHFIKCKNRLDENAQNYIYIRKIHKPNLVFVHHSTWVKSSKNVAKKLPTLTMVELESSN